MMHPGAGPNETHHAAGGYGPPGGGVPPGGFGPPPAGGFGGPPPPGQPAYPPPMGNPGAYQAGVASADGDAKNVLALILNIKALLGCGCMSGGLGLIPGIIGLVYAIQAGTAKSNGDFVTARAKVRTSLICCAINAGLGLLGFIAYFIFVSVVGATNGSHHH